MKTTIKKKSKTKKSFAPKEHNKTRSHKIVIWVLFGPHFTLAFIFQLFFPIYFIFVYLRLFFLNWRLMRTNIFPYIYLHNYFLFWFGIISSVFELSWVLMRILKISYSSSYGFCILITIISEFVHLFRNLFVCLEKKKIVTCKEFFF